MHVSISGRALEVTRFCEIISSLLLVVRPQAEFSGGTSAISRLAAHVALAVSPVSTHSMAALVASPLVLLPRDKKEDGLPNSSMFSTTPTTEQGLSRFTNNPITFVKASDPPPSSVPLSSKYEVLDDSKLPDVSKSSARVCRPLDCLVCECA